MSASDAAPLPRLGEVFFDVRGDSRTMRLSWYADTGVAVFSIWQGGTCTGTFRLPIADLPRMVTALQRGPGGQDERPGQADPAARAALPDEDGVDGHPPHRSLRPARPAGPDADVTTGQWDVPGGATPPGPRGADSGRGERPGGYLPEPGTGDPATGAYDYLPPPGYPAAARGAAAAPDETSYLPGPGSGAFPGDPPEPARRDEPGSGYLPGQGSGGFPAGPPEPDRRGRIAGRGYVPGPGSGEFGLGGPVGGGYAAAEPGGGEFAPGGPASGGYPAAEPGAAGFAAAEPGGGGFGLPEPGWLGGVPDPGYAAGRGSEEAAPEPPGPGRRSRRAGRDYVPDPGSGGFGGGPPGPAPAGPRLPEPGQPGYPGAGPDEYLPGPGEPGAVAAPEPAGAGFGLPEPGRREGVPDFGYLPGRGSEEAAPEPPGPGRRSRRAGRDYVPDPGSGGFGGGPPGPAPAGPRLPEPRLPEPGDYPPEPADGPAAGRSRRGRRTAGPEPGGYLPGPGSGDFPAAPDQPGYAPRQRGGRRAGPGDEPTGLIGAYEPAAPVGYTDEPDYPAPDSARDPQYSGDVPDADYHRVSPVRPYMDPYRAGDDGDSGEEWDGRALPPPGGYSEGPSPESFPYGPPAGNERRHRGNPGRH